MSSEPRSGTDATLLANPRGALDSAPPAEERVCSTCGASYPSNYRLCPTDGTVLGKAKSAGDDPLLGTVLAGTYRVLSILGEGGMGLVYESEHLRLDRHYAIKVIHNSFAGREDLLARFDREARAMSRVQSEHVVDVADVLRTPDGRPCIVTERLTGEDLEQYLASHGKLTLPKAVPLFRQILRGLSSAHAHGIVHRDLKPSNLFLSRDVGGGVTLKILDFGVAKVGGDAELTGTGAIVGTPAYMAPEQARGAANVDARSDIYAAGAVFYRMLAGRAPYGAADASVTLVRLLEEAPARPRSVEKSIPEAVEAIIERAMARDPSNRYATVQDLEEAIAPFDTLGTSTVLRSMVDEGPARADVARALARKARWTRPIVAGIAVLAALVAGASFGTLLALFVDGLRIGARIEPAEVVIVLLGSAGATATVLVATLRALRGAWRSLPEVEQLGGRWLRALGAGVIAFGAIELVARIWAVLVLSLPGAYDPLWASSRVFLSIAAALTTATATRRRR